MFHYKTVQREFLKWQYAGETFFHWLLGHVLLSSKRYFTKISMSGGPCNIHFCIFFCAYCSFSFLIFITARRPSNSRHSSYKFWHSRYYLSVGVLFSYKCYFIPIFLWFNSLKLDLCLSVTKKCRVMVDMYCL
jgi:hypothetical protein